MFRVLSIEFLKLRRSKMLWMAIITSILPAVIKYFQYVSEKSQGTVSWESFLTSGQEIMVLAMLTAVILVSSFVFSMEYQYNTASYIFTSNISKTNIFIAKLIALLAIIILLFVTVAFSELLFGYLALKSVVTWILFIKLVKVIVWYIFSYFLLSTVVIMLAVLIKRFVVSAVIALGYLMLVLPFHLKGNLYICPFMTPTAIAARLYSSSDYIFLNYYKDVQINNIGVVAFLLALAVVSLTIGIISYKQADAIK